MCDEATQILNRYTKGKSPEDLIFPNTLGELLSSGNARRKFKRWVKECGIEKDLHPHSLRGSYGVYLMDNGMELSAVSRNLRHAKVDTTAKYYSTYTASQRIKDQTAANQIFANISRHQV
ncbi:tyrosine-type recombinase/integrase [Oribacterium sp. WCC10]|uniref:tyrosine-type recombinase/integrase n=1 Tax=Oribacterium sp. WCC10 TaxID=1855343 RepID=UPI003FA56290